MFEFNEHISASIFPTMSCNFPNDWVLRCQASYTFCKRIFCFQLSILSCKKSLEKKQKNQQKVASSTVYKATYWIYHQCTTATSAPSCQAPSRIWMMPSMAWQRCGGGGNLGCLWEIEFEDVFLDCGTFVTSFWPFPCFLVEVFFFKSFFWRCFFFQELWNEDNGSGSKWCHFFPNLIRVKILNLDCWIRSSF